MRCRDANNRLTVQRDSHPARPAESQNTAQGGESSSSRLHDQPLVTPPSRMYPAVSTERIMQAVDQQRRVTQQLDDLRTRQKQRAALLRGTGLRLFAGVCFSVGTLAIVLIVLFVFQPDILVQLLALSSNAIATLIALAEGIDFALAQVPSNSWLLSGAALTVVLLTGMWLRLMRYPREA